MERLFNAMAILKLKKNIDNCFDEVESERAVLVRFVNLRPEINGGYERVRFPLSCTPQQGDALVYTIKGRTEQEYTRVLLNVERKRDYYEATLS